MNSRLLRSGTRRAVRGRGARKLYQVILPDLSLLKYHIPKLCAPGEALTPSATSPTISLCLAVCYIDRDSRVSGCPKIVYQKRNRVTGDLRNG